MLKIPSNFITIINDKNYKGYQGFIIHQINGTKTIYARVEAVEKIIILNITDCIFHCNNNINYKYINDELIQIKN
jgi:hypothetical protein